MKLWVLKEERDREKLKIKETFYFKVLSVSHWALSSLQELIRFFLL